MTETFGQRLKQYRKAKNMTQQELGEKIGVSDKTVSRWESDGGLPDVATLVPLARALGVTVDDLLDREKPVRTMTQADWQNLLSFAFALGGGVLYFLLDLFLPGAMSYLIYLACLCYGVYLQRYYTYRSRWFLAGEAVVNLLVNGSFVFGTLLWLWAAGTVASGDIFSLLGRAGLLLPGALLILALTAVTQYLIVKRGLGGAIPGLEEGVDLSRLRLTWTRPGLRVSLPALVPVLAGLFWLPAIQRALGSIPGLWLRQEALFRAFLMALAILTVFPLWKRGLRRWILPAWAMTAVCLFMEGLLAYTMARVVEMGEIYAYDPRAAYSMERFEILGEGTWGTVLLAAVLAAAWLIVAGLSLKREGDRNVPPGDDSQNS